MSETQWGEIKFDTMEVETDLAQQYFKDNKSTFASISTSSESKPSVEESDGRNVIHSLERVHYSAGYKKIKEVEEKYLVHDKLINLAQLVKEKAETFAQIEFELRKKPIEEVKAYDIKLIVNNLVNRNHVTACYITNLCAVRMLAETPLANIAFVAQIVMTFGQAIVYSSKQTAAVSHLFVKLCLEVGLKVELIIVRDEALNNWHLFCNDPLPEIKSGCVAVVTERSDCNSAVDVVLGTTTRYPWKLSRVLVQESVNVSFRRVLAQRAQGPAPRPDFDKLDQLTYDSFEGQGKVFLVDYAGDPESAGADKVFVEAYRTTKELISLLAKHRPHYLSLWSSDLAEANEIAHKTQAPVVWMNSYGEFDGPPQSSQAIYGSMGQLEFQEWAPKDLKETQAKWTAISFDERVRIVRAGIMKISPGSPLVKALIEVGNDDFVHVKGDHMCVGLSKPLCYQLLCPDYVSLAAIAKFLTSGCIVIIEGDQEYKYLGDLDKIIPFCRVNQGDFARLRPREYVNQMKVIWTNFGTIFAN